MKMQYQRNWWNKEETAAFIYFFPLDSLIGASLCISVPAYPLHHVMPSSGGRAVSQWCPPYADGNFVHRSSTSGGSSAACVALPQGASLESSESESSPWAASTRCLPLSGSISVRWCAGQSATRWEANVLLICANERFLLDDDKGASHFCYCPQFLAVFCWNLSL